MKAICIPVFNRPDELRATLQNIPRNKNWAIYVSIDHNAPKEVLQVIDQFRSRLNLTAWKNGSHYGSRLNTFTVCQQAIEKGAEAVLSMDDDITLSPDALELCEWFLRQPKLLDSKNSAGLALCRRFDNDSSRPEIITNDYHGHLGQGHCFTKPMWRDFIARSFWAYEDSYLGGADWSVNAEAIRTSRKVFRPWFARARHAGAIGYHGPGIGVFPDKIASGHDYNYRLE